jgi:hypothetical protein
MKNIRSFSKKHPVLLAIFGFALIQCLIYKIALVKISEPTWLQISSEIGELLYNVDLGIISSVIFFYVVVFTSQQKQKQLVFTKVEYHSGLIVNEGLRIFWHFCDTKKIDFPPNRDVCLSLSNSTDVRFTKEKGVDWHTLVGRVYKDINHDIDQLMRFPTTLTYFQNDELVGVVTKLGDASLFQYFNGVRVRRHWNKPDENTVGNISHLAEDLFMFFNLIHALMVIHSDEFGKTSLEKAKPMVMII